MYVAMRRLTSANSPSLRLRHLEELAPWRDGTCSTNRQDTGTTWMQAHAPIIQLGLPGTPDAKLLESSCQGDGWLRALPTHILQGPMRASSSSGRHRPKTMMRRGEASTMFISAGPLARTMCAGRRRLEPRHSDQERQHNHECHQIEQEGDVDNNTTCWMCHYPSRAARHAVRRPAGCLPPRAQEDAEEQCSTPAAGLLCCLAFLLGWQEQQASEWRFPDVKY